MLAHAWLHFERLFLDDLCRKAVECSLTPASFEHDGCTLRGVLQGAEIVNSIKSDIPIANKKPPVNPLEAVTARYAMVVFASSDSNELSEPVADIAPTEVLPPGTVRLVGKQSSLVSSPLMKRKGRGTKSAITDLMLGGPRGQTWRIVVVDVKGMYDRDDVGEKLSNSLKQTHHLVSVGDRIVVLYFHEVANSNIRYTLPSDMMAKVTHMTIGTPGQQKAPMLVQLAQAMMEAGTIIYGNVSLFDHHFGYGCEPSQEDVFDYLAGKTTAEWTSILGNAQLAVNRKKYTPMQKAIVTLAHMCTAFIASENEASAAIQKVSSVPISLGDFNDTSQLKLITFKLGNNLCEEVCTLKDYTNDVLHMQRFLWIVGVAG